MYVSLFTAAALRYRVFYLYNASQSSAFDTYHYSNHKPPNNNTTPCRTNPNLIAKPKLRNIFTFQCTQLRIITTNKQMRSPQ